MRKGIGRDEAAVMLSSLGAALPIPKERIDAVRVAVDVAFADGRLGAAEGRRVAHIADKLGLEEADLRSILAGRDGQAQGQRKGRGKSEGKAR